MRCSPYAIEERFRPYVWLSIIRDKKHERDLNDFFSPKSKQYVFLNLFIFQSQCICLPKSLLSGEFLDAGDL